MSEGKTRRRRTLPICVMLALWVASAAAAAEPALVKIWNWNIHDKKYQQKMYKLFNQRNPDVKIEYTSISNTVYDQTLEAAFIAKEPPDLFYPSGKLTFNYLREKGLIMALNDVAPTAKDLKDWMGKFPAALRKFVEGVTVFGGKPYWIDLSGTFAQLLPLFYNKTLYAEAGLLKPPGTQSELRLSAAKITSAGQGRYFGIVHGLRANTTWNQDLIHSLAFAAGARGGGPNLQTGKTEYGTPGFISAMNTWINMRTDGSVFPGELLMEDEQSKSTFATNKAGLNFGGWWNPGNYLAYNPDCNFDVVLPPTADDGVKRQRLSVSGETGLTGGYVVSSSAKYPAAVWKVIDFLSSLEYQEGYVQGGFGISYLPEADKRENFTIPAMYQFVEWGMDPSFIVTEPVLSEGAKKAQEMMPGIYPTLEDTLTNVYLQKTGLDALNDLDKRCGDALNAGIKKAQEAGYKVTIQDFIFPDYKKYGDTQPYKGPS